MHGKKGKKWKRVIEAKFILTPSCCSYKLARKQTLWQFHQKLGEFNYGWPTLQMNLVFRALNQNRADRIEVVIVTASERACPCFGHLKGGKQAHNNNPYWEVKKKANDIKYRENAQRQVKKQQKKTWKSDRNLLNSTFPFHDSLLEETIYIMHYLEHSILTQIPGGNC